MKKNILCFGDVPDWPNDPIRLARYDEGPTQSFACSNQKIVVSSLRGHTSELGSTLISLIGVHLMVTCTRRRSSSLPHSKSIERRSQKQVTVESRKTHLIRTLVWRINRYWNLGSTSLHSLFFFLVLLLNFRIFFWICCRCEFMRVVVMQSEDWMLVALLVRVWMDWWIAHWLRFVWDWEWKSSRLMVMQDEKFRLQIDGEELLQIDEEEAAKWWRRKIVAEWWRGSWKMMKKNLQFWGEWGIYRNEIQFLLVAILLEIVRLQLFC